MLRRILGEKDITKVEPNAMVYVDGRSVYRMLVDVLDGTRTVIRIRLHFTVDRDSR